MTYKTLTKEEVDQAQHLWEYWERSDDPRSLDRLLPVLPRALSTIIGLEDQVLELQKQIEDLKKSPKNQSWYPVYCSECGDLGYANEEKDLPANWVWMNPDAPNPGGKRCCPKCFEAKIQSSPPPP